MKEKFRQKENLKAPACESHLRKTDYRKKEKDNIKNFTKTEDTNP